MSGKKPLVVVCGPTASGKSALAVQLALRFSGEVVSADSMQVYRGMDIGTAKPTTEEMRGVPHHMISCADVGQAFSAAAYREQARACIEGIHSRGRLPILCGGTGLYISAVVYPLDFSNIEADETTRAELAAFAVEHGNEALHARLAAVDPQAALAIHPNNVRRVIRALERAEADKGRQPEDQRIFNAEPLYDLAWIGLTMDREALYRRIDARVDDMMRRGLLEEVTALAASLGNDSTAFQALGYKELLEHLNGDMTLEEAVAHVKQGTRNYAKRQLTWFKRERSVRWLDAGELTAEELTSQASECLMEILGIEPNKTQLEKP